MEYHKSGNIFRHKQTPKTNAERQRDHRERNAASRDPLFEALILKLRETWNAADGGARLDLMRQLLDLAYGAARPKLVMPGSGLTPAAIVEDQRMMAAPAPHAGYDYFIDLEGFARRDPNGSRINADAIPEGEIVYDERPVRDRDTITWADGSQGAPPGLNFCGPGAPPGLD